MELVIFLNCLSGYEDQRTGCAGVLADMRAQLESWCGDLGPGLSLRFPQQNSSRALCLQLVSTAPESCVGIRLLPAFDAVGKNALLGPWGGDRDPGSP